MVAGGCGLFGGMGGLCSKGSAGERQPLTGETRHRGAPHFESMEDRLAMQRQRREKGMMLLPAVAALLPDVLRLRAAPCSGQLVPHLSV